LAKFVKPPYSFTWVSLPISTETHFSPAVTQKPPVYLMRRFIKSSRFLHWFHSSSEICPTLLPARFTKLAAASIPPHFFAAPFSEADRKPQKFQSLLKFVPTFNFKLLLPAAKINFSPHFTPSFFTLKIVTPTKPAKPAAAPIYKSCVFIHWLRRPTATFTDRRPFSHSFSASSPIFSLFSCRHLPNYPTRIFGAHRELHSLVNPAHSHSPPAPNFTRTAHIGHSDIGRSPLQLSQNNKKSRIISSF
jgi:hypothetical protein